MAIARHGTGPRPALSALLSQVHPVFMLPPVASSWFGAVLAGPFDVAVGAVHAVAIFAAVYTAHVKDGYVDFHVRSEDDDHPLTAAGCQRALVAATGLFLVALAGVLVLGGPLAAALTLPTWLVAYNHAPTLDVHPVGATAGYPTGIALAVLGGYAAQTGTLSATPAGFAAVFLVMLCGVKVIDDSTDVGYDRSIGKRSVPAVLGYARARRLAFGLMTAAMALVVAFAAAGVFPPATALATVAFGAVAAFAARAGADAELATMLLVRGAYVFLAALVAGVWFRPLVAYV